MSADRRQERRALLDQIVALQMAMQVGPDAETRAQLAQAREALRSTTRSRWRGSRQRSPARREATP
jgi:hypothetical protein